MCLAGEGQVMASRKLHPVCPAGMNLKSFLLVRGEALRASSGAAQFTVSMKASQAPFLQSWVQTGSETHVRLSLCASVPTFGLEKVAASRPFLPSSRRSCHT